MHSAGPTLHIREPRAVSSGLVQHRGWCDSYGTLDGGFVRGLRHAPEVALPQPTTVPDPECCRRCCVVPMGLAERDTVVLRGVGLSTFPATSGRQPGRRSVPGREW